MAKLIGSSGFVGSNIRRLYPSIQEVSRAQLYGSSPQIHCDVLIIAAPSAEKWRANADAHADQSQVQQLVQAAAETFKPESVLLFSTVDVYANKRGPTEFSLTPSFEPYGQNRLMLENSLRQVFETVAVARLPALFGPGLRKNLMFDVVNNRNEWISTYHPSSTFQWLHIDTAIHKSFDYLGTKSTVNIVSEPIAARDIPIPGSWRSHLSLQAKIFTYDIQTSESASGYFFSKGQVLESIRNAFMMGAIA